MSQRSILTSGPPILACHACAAIHEVLPVAHGKVADCRACGSPLYRGKGDRLEVPLALNLAALLLLIVAHAFPIITFKLEGQEQVATLLTGPLMLYERGYWPLAILVFLACSAIPGLRTVMGIAVLGPLAAGHRPAYGPRLLRWIEVLAPWAMMEVYILGLIVGYVKLSDLATLAPGLSLFAFMCLIIVLMLVETRLDPRVVWERFAPQARAGLLQMAPRGVLACHDCGQVVAVPAEPEYASCPRCAAHLHRRKPGAVARAWALALTAIILYIPANLLPVMTVVFFGHGEADTIMSGVIALIQGGMIPVAALIFFASITVPVLKLLGLIYLLISVQRGSVRNARQRTLAYRIIEGVGRWSMVDIFMISILVALVNLGAIATIVPGDGALAFAAVVVLTMIAAGTFDSRLIWDARQARGLRDAAVRA